MKVNEKILKALASLGIHKDTILELLDKKNKNPLVEKVEVSIYKLVDSETGKVSYSNLGKSLSRKEILLISEKSFKKVEDFLSKKKVSEKISLKIV